MVDTLAVPNSESAVRVALSYGPQIIVLEPEELWSLMGKRARAAAALYEGIEQGEKDG